MKLYKKIILISTIMQSFSSLCMEADDQHQIETKEKPISFCSPISIAFPDHADCEQYFRIDERLPLSEEMRIAIIGSIKLKPSHCINPQAHITPNTVPVAQESKNVKLATANSQLQLPDKTATAKTNMAVQPSKSKAKNHFEDEDYEIFDKKAVEEKAINTYKRLVNWPKQSNFHKGPYLHQKTGILFIPIDGNQTCIYKYDTGQFAFLPEPYEAPTQEYFNKKVNKIFSAFPPREGSLDPLKIKKNNEL